MAYEVVRDGSGENRYIITRTDTDIVLTLPDQSVCNFEVFSNEEVELNEQLESLGYPPLPADPATYELVISDDGVATWIIASSPTGLPSLPTTANTYELVVDGAGEGTWAEAVPATDVPNVPP